MKLNADKLNASTLAELLFVIPCFAGLIFMAYQFETEVNRQIKKTHRAQEKLDQAHRRSTSHNQQENWTDPRNRYWTKPDPFFARW